MDNGGIWPGDESYFQNIRETALQDTIEQLTKELAEARAEIERLKSEEQAQIDMLMSVTGGSSVCANGSRHTIIDKCLYCELADKDKQLAEAQAEIERLNKKIEARNVAVRIQVAMINDKDKLIEQMRDALQWYKEQVSSCNRNGDAGELARDRLAKDVGKRAEAALSAAERINK